MRLFVYGLRKKYFPSTINHQPSTINHQPSTINHQPSTINYLTAIIDISTFTNFGKFATSTVSLAGAVSVLK